MSKTVTIGGENWSPAERSKHGMQWKISDWVHKEVPGAISEATELITIDLAHEIEEILVKAYHIEPMYVSDTVTITGFKQTAEEQLWLDIRRGDWQRVVDWAIYFARFSGVLNGKRYNGVKVDKLLTHLERTKNIG